jgi:EAL domain-containing protein (putative c-di-GMP-specific phosphodiesterase class I)/GGDEF domain-containing protein
MLASGFAPEFAVFSEATRPVPAEYAEPLERLLDTLQPGSVTLLLRADAASAGWLDADTIERCLHAVLIEPVRSSAWPLLADVWAISLRVPESAEWELTPQSIHVLRRTLAERLDAEWQAERGKKPLVLVDTEDLPPEESNTDALDVPQMPLAFTVWPVAPFLAGSEMQDNIAELNSLLEIILNKQLHTQFQPIVNLRTGQVLAYEALIRSPKGALLRRPGQMFRAADKAQMVAWYDIACLDQCFAQAAQMGFSSGKKKLLFVNMEAEGLAYLDLYDRSLSLRAREHGLNPAGIVLEITERQTLDDFPRLKQFIEKLREEGFQIAIDDVGTGYNSLLAIAELRPDFVKIDHGLVRNIDTNGAHRALLEAIVQYARHIGTAVLAEGIETRGEMATVINMGIPYGQGYLMGRPADDFRGVPRETREFMQQNAEQRDRLLLGRALKIGELARPGLAYSPETPIGEVAKKLAKDESLTSVVIVEDGFARGLLMRDQLQHVLDMASAAQVAELMPSQTLSQWMQTDVLFVDAEKPLGEVARQATSCEGISLQTDIIVVRDGNQYVGVVPPRTLMEMATALQENRQRYADPLTGLPNYVVLEQELRERIGARKSFVALRADLTKLEPFVRRFGVSQGDDVLVALGQILQEVSAAQGGPEDFLAHLGSDDFLLLTKPERVGAVCRALVTEYEQRISRFFTQEVLRQGYFEIEENGSPRRYSLLRLSVAAQSSQTRRWTHPAQVLDTLNETLRTVKKRPGNFYLIE